MINHQNSFFGKKSLNITRNKSKNRILKKKSSVQKPLSSKTQVGPLKNKIIHPQKLQKEKIIGKRNIPSIKKIPSTTACIFGPNKPNIKDISKNNTLNNNNNSKYNIHLNEKNKKLISLKTIKKQILMGPLMIPNSFLFSHKESQNVNNNEIKNDKKNLNKNNIYKNYLSHKNSTFEVNSLFLYNNSISNCNTTCNTHTNSNNKSNSFHKSILKKNSENAICCRINRIKSQKIDENISKIQKSKDKNNNLYLLGKSKLLLNSINNNETKTENYIKNAEEYIDDILENLLEEEKQSKLKIAPAYFHFQSDINSKMRAILIDWLIDVHLKFNFKQETLYITIYIIDTYLSLEKIERCNFQLLGVTALFIACKQNEILFRKLNEYVYITDNAYTENDIRKMENKILHILDFNILFPSSLTFYEILFNKLNLYKDKKIFNFGEFIMESFYLDENNLKYSPSTIACAIGYIVMKYFKIDNYKECYNPKIFNIKPVDEFIEKFSKSNNYHVYIIKECAKDICFSMNELSKGNLKSTIRKYSSEKYENVSNLLFRNLTSIN